MAASGQEHPIITAPDQLPPEFVSPAAYDKPALALRLLREAVVGPDRFDPAFKEYFRRWAYKHPAPADFFRTIEDGVGEDLSWFWRAWFYTTQQLDQAVDSVTAADSTGVESQIHLRNAGGIPMPVELGLLMDDGSTRRLRLPVEIWYRGDRYVHEDRSGKTLVEAQVNPDGTFPDAVATNDAWKAGDPGLERTSTESSAGDERR